MDDRSSPHTGGTDSVRIPIENSSNKLHDLNSPEGIEAVRKFAALLLELNHDLNNPLAGIIGYLDLALNSDHDIPEDLKSMLQSVQLSAEMMDKLIRKFAMAKQDLIAEVDFTPALANRPEVLR